ncbi:MAG: hypothetical protein VYA54_03145 [Bdellovibrionota bacterium]|nr:hypothetical protein [Bdellovibrionota bacterium]
MKYLLTITLLTLSTISFAQEFNPCSEADMRLLEVAKTRHRNISAIVREELLDAQGKCTVSKPRRNHPAVCGIKIGIIDTFKFRIDRRTSYEVVVDSSYISCQRNSRNFVIPQIRSLKFEEAILLTNTRDM